jgi:hypothetical protein
MPGRTWIELRPDVLNAISTKLTSCKFRFEVQMNLQLLSTVVFDALNSGMTIRWLDYMCLVKLIVHRLCFLNLIYQHHLSRICLKCAALLHERVGFTILVQNMKFPMHLSSACL